MQKRKPKILVLNVDVWNNDSGSDTFINLLSNYGDEYVANIFFKAGIPNNSICNYYFYISETAVIKSIFNRAIKTGYVIDKNINHNNNDIISSEKKEESKRYSFFLKYRWYIFLLGRELLWKLGHWNSKELNRFIDDFKPDILLFPIEGYLYFNNICNYIIDKYKIPAIGIVWDDNFTFKTERKSIGYLFYRYLLRNQVKTVLNKCARVYSIIDKTKSELKEVIGIDSEIITKGAIITEKCINRPIELPIKIVYAGKLNIGRIDTIQLVANEIKRTNQINGIVYNFDIYTGTTLDNKTINNIQGLGVRLLGKIKQSDVRLKLQDADILLFAEALSGKYANCARLSFSTKLVDYLSTGKCIIAIGPQDNASIQYLQHHNAAIVISNLHDLVKHIKTLYRDKDKIEEMGKNAKMLALSKHNISDIQYKLYNNIYNIVKF